MRITEQQRKMIVEATHEIFGERASVRLFGSRADDTKLGGDIDLYVKLDGVDGLKQSKSDNLYARICSKAGDVLPIDIVVADDETEQTRIHQEGMAGIAL